ncbi:MAG: hypothetical protein GY777_03970 [Candidatus Brocadiaceae bacterium]|nr:hypothetical protein [Candidatus Brocadiaceae bacterium]
MNSRRAFIDFVVSLMVAMCISTAAIYILGNDTPMGMTFGDAASASVEFLIKPIEALSWLLDAQIAVPIFAVITIIGFTIKSAVIRVITFQVVTLLWLFFGLICAASVS